jgi:hypothetical protein
MKRMSVSQVFCDVGHILKFKDKILKMDTGPFCFMIQTKYVLFKEKKSVCPTHKCIWSEEIEMEELEDKKYRINK